ncbi:MAG: DUF1653 domain-containing protein [Candidatus Saccharimonadales bacterium]
MSKIPYRVLEKMVDDTLQLIPRGSRWRHYKGSEYTISDIVIIETTNELAVVYTPIDHPSVSFVRALPVWQETVNWQNQAASRFTKIV